MPPESPRKIKKDEGGPPGFGMGLQPSPFDPHDFELAAIMAPPAAAFPTSFLVPNGPPVLNQGATPQCVAYSASSMKAWQDRIDQALWYNLDEARFFTLIGGTSSGANLKAAQVRMLNYGYPVYGGALSTQSQHRIRAYYSASLAHDDLKAALMAFGPLIVGIHWPASWSHPGTGGKVPAPSGATYGHAILLVGWKDGTGFRFRNSWGTLWGAAGDCYIPASYLSTAGGLPIRAFEAWKALDVIDPAPVTIKYCNGSAGARIRSAMSGTSTLIVTLPVTTKMVYKGTFAGGAYQWWNGSAWVTRTDWAKVVYSGVDRYVVRVNVTLL